MGFIVEDGTVVAGATSLAPVDYADEHFADRGYTAWSELSVEQKQVALIKATDFLDRRYGGRWRGHVLGVEQELSWPRKGVYAFGERARPVAEDEIPSDIQKATVELARRVVELDDLQPDTIPGTSAVKREKVGPLEVEYADAQLVSSPFYSAVVDLVRPYLRRHSGVVETVRA